jgi:SAM-dependent methyltransferase
MKAYDDASYGERIATVYDSFYPGHEEGAIDLLFELAAGGRVLELGIGTGRMALPLAERGLEVLGIDASPAMTERLRAKPGGDRIRVVQGSFAEMPAALDGERFDLIFVVFNTFFALLTQEEQVQCFRSAAAHLTNAGLRRGPGCFLIEAFVPDLARYEDGQAVRLVHLSQDAVRLDVAQLDPVAQQIASQHVVLTEEGLQLYPVKLRYAWPTELDLMAELAGLTLQHRWGSWRKDPFTKESGKHISVYGPADQPVEEDG